MAHISSSLTFCLVGYNPSSNAALIFSPDLVVVEPMRLTTTSRLNRGRPLQLWAIYHRRRPLKNPKPSPTRAYLSSYDKVVADRYIDHLRDRALELPHFPELGRARNEILSSLGSLLARNHLLLYRRER